MSKVEEFLLCDSRKELLRKVVGVVGQEDLHECFAAWLLGEAISDLNVATATAEVLRVAEEDRTARQAAILGFAAHASHLDSVARTALFTSLQQIVKKEPVVFGTPMPFCTNGLALLGIALGAKASEDSGLWDKALQWIRRCRDEVPLGQQLEEFDESLLAMVAFDWGLDWPIKPENAALRAEMLVGLRPKGFFSSLPPTDFAQHELDVLSVICRTSNRELSVPHAALRLAALDWITRQKPTVTLNTISAADIGQLLRRVPGSLKRWTWEDRGRTKNAPARKWYIDNEYHVQNLLWILLSPLFPDLSDEVYTEKVGSVQPRADLYIASLQLVIEVKFMRRRDSSQDMVRQIAQDASLYRAKGSGYGSIIAFVWDDSCRVQLHEEMTRGLCSLPGVIDAVVVPRPGNMDVALSAEQEEL